MQKAGTAEIQEEEAPAESTATVPGAAGVPSAHRGPWGQVSVLVWPPGLDPTAATSCLVISVPLFRGEVNGVPPLPLCEDKWRTALPARPACPHYRHVPVSAQGSHLLATGPSPRSLQEAYA